MLRVADLDGMAKPELRAAWEKYLGCPVPPNAREPYIRAAVAYTLQERAGRRLSKPERRLLTQFAETMEAVSKEAIPRTRAFKAGSKLIREWNGVVHEVNVLEGGFEYRGERYQSLSAIARHITGARWSGPRFFGLTSRENPIGD